MTTKSQEKRTAVIRTSDRLAYMHCRRKWDWSSHLRRNLGTKVTGNPLWLGQGVHFALEDYHSENVYGSPDKAFQAFVAAYGRKYPDKTPDDWEVEGALGVQMMQYYSMWLNGRDPLTTYVHNGVPQVEVSVKIPIPIEILPKNQKIIGQNWDEIIYSMTFDRIAIDEHGALWLVEYKTAKQMATQHFLLDPQITTYVWGMRNYYDKPIGGVIYQQHKKATPKAGRILAAGGVSFNQQQATTHRMYRKTLQEVYGERSGDWPEANVKFLNSLAAQESEHADAFIRRDYINRNEVQGQSMAQQILMQTSEMLDPDLQLYPNPSRMCNMFCSFEGACVSKDDGSDWEHELELECEPRPAGYDEWRDKLPEPKTFEGLKVFQDVTIGE